VIRVATATNATTQIGELTAKTAVRATKTDVVRARILPISVKMTPTAPNRRKRRSHSTPKSF
jgi:hypothetical protein